jgi:type III restriction enzyme
VADTKTWEQSAAYILDTHKAVDAFVKNAGLGFGIPYFHNGQSHEYVPDFIVRLNTNPITHLILETKGFDELMEVKTQAARRWISAVNADGNHGKWKYLIAMQPSEITHCINRALDAGD